MFRTFELTMGVEIAAWRLSLSSPYFFREALVDASSLKREDCELKGFAPSLSTPSEGNLVVLECNNAVNRWISDL